MLTLPFRKMGEVLVASDDSEPRRSWVVSAVPKVARRPDGSPRLRLSTFTRAGDAATNGGGAVGRLSIDVDVRATPEALSAAGLDPSQALPLPWLDAELELRGPELDPVISEVALALGEGGAVADLDARATEIVAAVLQADSRASLSLTWRGHVRARLPAIEVVATADIEEIRQRTASMGRMGPGQLTVVTRSIVDANARILITGGADAELEATLGEWACDALARRLASGEPLSVRATAADVVRMPLAIAGTIEDSVRPAERATLREEIVLDPDDLLARRIFEVRPLGDLGGAIERVDVELASGGVTTRLELIDARSRRITVPPGELEWRRRVAPRGEQPGAWSSWARVQSTTGLVVSAVLPSSRTLEIIAAGFDFASRWRSIRVELGRGGRSFTAVELGPHKPSEGIELPAVDGLAAVHADVVCLAHSGYIHRRRLETWDGDQLVIEDPFATSGRSLTLVPTGTGWSDVAMTLIDLVYEDGERVVRETLSLSRLDEIATWRVPAGPGAPPAISWRRHTSFSDGRFESTTWQRTEESVMVIPIAGIPRRTVQLLPIHLEPGTRVRARLTSGDVVREATLADRSPASMDIPVGPYRLWLAWTMRDGSERLVADHERNDDVVVIPRPALA